MHHKLQNSSTTNAGSKTVVPNRQPDSASQIANNDGGSRERASTDPAPEANSGGNSAFSVGLNTHSLPRTVPTLICEVARSDGYDPTGEHAVPCGASAQVLCEYCGPMCSRCADETFCVQDEHKLKPLPDDDPLPQSSEQRPPINEVVYVEIKCPKCRHVRLALPKNHHVKARRKCPVCRREAPAMYLAHGFRRRRLPYHEVFTTEEENAAEEKELKCRTPWDLRPKRWVEE